MPMPTELLTIRPPPHPTYLCHVLAAMMRKAAMGKAMFIMAPGMLALLLEHLAAALSGTREGLCAVLCGGGGRAV